MKPMKAAMGYFSEANVRRLVEILDDTERMLFIKDVQNNEFLFANKACLKYLGMNERDLEDDAGCLQEVKRDLKGRFTEYRKTSRDASIVFDEAEKRYFDLREQEIVWQDRVLAFVYLSDITERIEKEEEEKSRYKRHLKAILRMNRHAISSTQVNLTQNTCATTYMKQDGGELPTNASTYEQFVYYLSCGCYDEIEKKKFQETFRRENLLEEYAAGNHVVQLRHSFLMGNGKYLLLTTTIDLICNPYTGDIEGIFYSHDVTGAYLDRQIKKLLLEKQYESIALIDVERDALMVYNGVVPETAGINSSVMDSGRTYKQLCDFWADYFIPVDEREQFLKDATLENVLEMLAKSEMYEITLNIVIDAGVIRQKRMKYFYLDYRKDTIVLTEEDLTSTLENDFLTGGFNRKGFVDHAELILSKRTEKEEFAILFFDVNRFKAINERFGVSKGDIVLRNCHESIKKSALEPLVVGRLEADHFVCLVEKDKLNFDILTSLCHNTCNVGDKRFDCSCQCGIYIISDKTEGVNGMCDRASLAKEYIEDPYLHPYAIFNASMKVAYMAKNEILSELDAALKNQEFVVYYQPIYSAKEKKLVAAEALIRWNSPKQGMISPGVFIPALEENGHISEVDAFVAQRVRAFQAERHQNKRHMIPVEINLSWSDFYDKNLIENIIHGIQSAGSPMGSINIEITESTYSSIAEESSEVLRRIRNAGSKILVDDFGSGYSSFSTIQDLDFDVLKLDMGFVRKIGNNEKAEQIIASMITMAHSIHAQVIAEGVETQEQLDFLVAHDCDLIQGYYFSKPLPEEEFIALLDMQSA